MLTKANLAIGIAILARGFVACHACLPPAADAASGAAQLRPRGEHRITVPTELNLLLRRREIHRLAQDPARSRPSVTPVPRATYQLFPRSA